MESFKGTQTITTKKFVWERRINNFMYIAASQVLIILFSHTISLVYCFFRVIQGQKISLLSSCNFLLHSKRSIFLVFCSWLQKEVTATSSQQQMFDGCHFSKISYPPSMFDKVGFWAAIRPPFIEGVCF